MIDKEDNWSKSRSFPESLRNATRGLKLAFKNESNLQRQIIFFVAAILLAVLLQVPLFHFAVIVLMSTIVLVLEIINTAFEALADATYPEYNEIVRSAKDIFAGAVLLASLMAVIIASLIFLPPLIRLVT